MVVVSDINVYIAQSCHRFISCFKVSKQNTDDRKILRFFTDSSCTLLTYYVVKTKFDAEISVKLDFCAILAGIFAELIGIFSEVAK